MKRALLQGWIWTILLVAGTVKAEEGFSIKPRFWLESSYTHVRIDTAVPVHPDDHGTTAVKVELNAGIFNLAPKVGLALSYNFAGKVKIIGGADVRLNLSGLYGADGYRKGYYKVERFTEHPWESYAYLQLQEVDWYNIVPFVGISFVSNQDKELLVGVTYSFYETKYKVESGWDRYGRFQEYRSESLGGDSQRWGLTIQRKEEEEDIGALILEIFYETGDFEQGRMFERDYDMWGISVAITQ